jgi:hypothetical protein
MSNLSQKISERYRKRRPLLYAAYPAKPFSEGTLYPAKADFLSALHSLCPFIYPPPAALFSLASLF